MIWLFLALIGTITVIHAILTAPELHPDDERGYSDRQREEMRAAERREWGSWE